MLEDYPRDADEAIAENSDLACPVFFAPQYDKDSTVDRLLQCFEGEIQNMTTWYEQACQERQRTTALVSGLRPLDIAAFFADFITGGKTSLANENTLSDLLRRASEDLKAFYLEAVSAQPGQAIDVQSLADWFWGETCAAIVINEIRKICLQDEAKDMQLTGRLLLVPRNQLYRFKGD